MQPRTTKRATRAPPPDSALALARRRLTAAVTSHTLHHPPL